MLKYLVALVFVALAWASALVFRGIAPLFWLATGLSLLLPLSLLIYDLGRRRTTRRASSALENGLDSAGAHIRPDQQAEIAAMQAEFRKALHNLKSSRLSAGGKDALAALPWYLIIGPPGAGKTTALRSSGLPFPYAKGGRVKGVGGTRNCDWWLTNQAVILDTAGRWATQDDDREEWLAFLDLLKQTRPQKPVNGILVAVSANDLQGDSEDISHLARTLRERIDEVMGRLDMVVPVYLLVTKSDLLAGFIETFGDLRDKERGQIWGVTLPLLASADERIELLAGHLDELAQVTEQRSWTRMHEERRVGARFTVFAFPQQVRTLKQPLLDLAAELFTDNVYQDSPILRGIYFTSGTQEGRPLDRIMQSMAESFGLAPRAEAVAVSKPKSYFVRDLFTNLVFADKDVAIRSTRVLVRQRLWRIALTACALLTAIGLLVVPVRSYGTASTAVSQARRLVDRLARSPQATGLPSAESLESLENAAKLLTETSDGSLLFPASSFHGPLRTAIGETAQDEGAVQVASEFEALLRFASVKPSGFDQYDQILVEVAAALGEQGTPDAKVFQTAVRSGRTNLAGLLARTNDRGWEQGVLERILMPALRGTEAALLGASAELANRKWCETVVVAFDELLAGKFPFVTGKAADEARLADVEKFFAPNTGILWQYFTQSVQPDVEQAGSIFRMKEGASLRYQEAFLSFWSRAQDITRRLFAKDPSKLGMLLEVRIRPSAQYSKIVFDAGTRKLVGLNALDRWDEILWPSRRALLRLYVKSEEAGTIGPEEDSDWALYRLLTQGAPSKSRDVLSLSFASPDQGKVQLDFRPEGVRELFARFTLPRSITQGAGACRR